jgi:hypothetical protein
VLSPLVSLECEKRAIRDFHVALVSEAKGNAHFTFPNGRPTPDLKKGGQKDSELSEHPKIMIQEMIPQETAITTPMDKMQWNLPQTKSFVPNETFSRVVEPDIHIRPSLSIIPSNKSSPPIFGPNFQDIQNIKNMILTLQIDLQDERTKRECLEEKVRKFEANLTRKSHETPEHKWHLSDMRVSNEVIPQDQSFLPAQNTINDVDEKIGEFRSDFDLRLHSLERSLLEIRSILAKSPLGSFKSYNKSSSEAGLSEDKDYNTFLYKKLERGVFPPQISLKNAITKSLGELLQKPKSEKTEIEALMDQYYLENLPPAFLPPPATENEDCAPRTELQFHPIPIREPLRKIP